MPSILGIGAVPTGDAPRFAQGVFGTLTLKQFLKLSLPATAPLLACVEGLGLAAPLTLWHRMSPHGVACFVLGVVPFVQGLSVVVLSIPFRLPLRALTGLAEDPFMPLAELLGGEEVLQNEWKNIGCEICHQPIGDSYRTGISFWDQAGRRYEPVESVGELCAKCHEGQHGFEVVEEQQESPAHNQWECTLCHGAHGAPSACIDCHDLDTASGKVEHEQHPSVNCTACHDHGGLSIWLDAEPASENYGEYIPRKFAHTLTSWPSHNLAKEVDCLRCHHPPSGGEKPVVAKTVSCLACHPEGGVLFWCAYFTRNPDPNPTPTSTGVP